MSMRNMKKKIIPIMLYVMMAAQPVARVLGWFSVESWVGVWREEPHTSMGEPMVYSVGVFKFIFFKARRRALRLMSPMALRISK